MRREGTSLRPVRRVGASAGLRVFGAPAPDAAPSLRPVLAVLERAFAHFDATLFGRRLSPVVIATHPRGRVEAWGWYKSDGWGGDGTGAAEINVAADGLRRPPEDVLLTLLVQMVRHGNAQTGIKDAASRGQCLNRRFKTAAIAAGLVPPAARDPRTGYAAVSLGPAAAREVGTLAPELQAACRLARLPAVAAPTPGLVGHECGCAGAPKVWTFRKAFAGTRCRACGEAFREAPAAQG